MVSDSRSHRRGDPERDDFPGRNSPAGKMWNAFAPAVCHTKLRRLLQRFGNAEEAVEIRVKRRLQERQPWTSTSD